MRRRGEKASTPCPPSPKSSWDLNVGVGGEDRTLLGLAGERRRRCGGPTGASPLPRTPGCSYTPKPSRKLRGSPFLSTVQPAARRDHRTPPPLRWGGGMGPRQWVGREFPLSGDSRARGPHAPPAGRAPLRTVLAARRSGRPQATRCSLGRKLGATPRDQRVKKERRAGGVEARAAGEKAESRALGPRHTPARLPGAEARGRGAWESPGAGSLAGERPRPAEPGDPVG